MLRRRVVPWMASRPRGHWRVVQLALERRGLIEPGQSPEAFARRLAEALPEVGEAQSLAKCMRRYKLMRDVDAGALDGLRKGDRRLMAVRYVERMTE